MPHAEAFQSSHEQLACDERGEDPVSASLRPVSSYATTKSQGAAVDNAHCV